MNERVTDRGCPTEEVWLDFLDANAGGGLVADRGALESHLETCGVCTEHVDELRRFNTLLLRSRVPGLSDDQWRVLDERMEMMGSEYVPPPKVATKVYFGLAMAAALGLFAVGIWHLVNEPSGVEAAIAKVEATAPVQAMTQPAVLQAGAVEGVLQVADASGSWRTLQPGETLTEGAKLRTGANAQARLVVPGHFELRVGKASELIVLAANDRSTWLRLRRGEVGCQVEKRRPNQQFKVLAGRFRASVVGTEFVVRHQGADAAVSVHVTEGAVRVDEAEEPEASVSETTTLVRAGNRWRTVGGQVEFGPIQPAKAAQKTAQQPKEVMPVAPEPTPDNDVGTPQLQVKTKRVATRTATRSKPAEQRPTTTPQTGESAAAKAKEVMPGEAQSEATAANATRKAKVVEIDVPAQWHDQAHEYEVKRLENLSADGQKARKDGKKAAATVKPEANGGK